MPLCARTALLAVASLAITAAAAHAADTGTDNGNNRDLQQQREACSPGWDVTCQDNPLYTTRLGLDCAMHVVVDCNLMVEIGFTPAERDELVLNCPCSCSIEW